MHAMKRVYLLRHAKSSWKVGGVPDHDRPLAPRGRRAASAIAGHLLEEGIEPELVLCSTARRARETLERIAPVLGTPVAVVLYDDEVGLAVPAEPHDVRVGYALTAAGVVVLGPAGSPDIR